MDMFCMIPSAVQRACANFSAKHGSRLLIIFHGSPKHLNMCMRYSPATSLAEIASLHSIKIATLEQSWSVTVNMKSYPSEGGNLTIKSIATVSNGSTPGVGKMGHRLTWA